MTTKDDDNLTRIATDIAELRSAIAAGCAAFLAALGVKGLPSASASSGSTSEGSVAPDSDLDSQYGDPQVRRDPSAKYWTGQSWAGYRLSECPTEYLDAFAKYKDACAYANEKEGKPEKKKYIGYDRKDAARARGWAARLRAGWKSKNVPNGRGAAPPATDEDYDDGENDDIPF